jgi:hypothetical protein
MKNEKICVSVCKEFPKAECNPPRCEYVNGETRKYCRLSSKYVMKRPSCTITRKIKKKDEVEHARKRITNFVKRTKTFLQIVCSKSGECLNFGKNIGEISGIFKGFTGFEYAISPIKKLGSPSANGFVKEIEYDNNGYKAYAALKSSQRRKSDNLVYEYLVGVKFINRIIKRFPCFVETYGLYYYNSDEDRIAMSNTIHLNHTLLEKLELQNSINYKKACDNSILASVLIQHIHSAKPIRYYVNKYSQIIEFDLIYILFIIYHALASLKKQFTHYDLHDENVLLFEPNPNKYIHYKYHLLDGSLIEFYCRFIPKIIDYGRSFFDNGNINSKKIYDRVCKECPNCGINSGFTWLNPIPEYGISSQKKNESHDLRLLYMISLRLNKLENDPTIIKYHNFNELLKMFKKVIYGIGVPKLYKMYGTEEHLNLPLKGYIIGNVTDAYEYLKEMIAHPNAIKTNKLYEESPHYQKSGTFHIYENGRAMEYIPE